MPRKRYAPLFPYEPGYPPTWRGRVPRLIDAEKTLLFNYLDRQGKNIDELWYDVRMDGIPDSRPEASLPAADLPPDLLRDWWMQTARRADAIARRGSTHTIVELRALADAQTIGELEIYDTLARAEWPTLTWSSPALIANRVRPTALAVLQAKAVTLHLYPELDVHPSVPVAGITR